MLLMAGEHDQLLEFFFGCCETCSEHWFQTKVFLLLTCCFSQAFVEELANSCYNLRAHSKFYRSKGKEKNNNDNGE